jgi:hypothetical protein
VSLADDDEPAWSPDGTQIAFRGAIFALASGAADVTTAPPADVAAGMRITVAVAAVLLLVALWIAVGIRAPRLIGAALARLS